MYLIIYDFITVYLMYCHMRYDYMLKAIIIYLKLLLYITLLLLLNFIFVHYQIQVQYGFHLFSHQYHEM